MHKHLFKLVSFLSILLLCFQLAHSQGTSTDSMQRLLDRSNLPDSVRINTLLQLGWDLSFKNADSSRLYLDETIRLAEKNKDENSIATALSYIGTGYLNTDHFDSAQLFYRKAEIHFLKDTSSDAKENVIVNRMSMGTVALQQGFYETAIEYYLNAVDYIDHHPTTDGWKNLLTAYANIGLVYNDLKQFDKALEYHTRAFKISNSHPEELKKRVQVQLFLALDELNLKNYENAWAWIETADATAQKIDGDYFYSMLYALKGRYFNEREQYKKSIASSVTALKYAKAANQKFQESNIFYQLGISYFKLANYLKSQEYLSSALSINRKLKDKMRERATLGYLGRAYAESNDFRRASKYFQEYIQLSDSLNRAESKKRINEIENKYQSEKKQLQIASLEKDNQLQRSELKHKRTLNGGLAAGCILLLLLAGLFYFNFKNKNRLLKQSEMLHRQKLSEIESERKLFAAQSVMKGQEEERRRLARDLHDGVGGLLSGVKLSLSTMKGNVFLSEKNAQSVSTIIDQLDQSISELRRVSHNMMPEVLFKYGLNEALENYCESMNRFGKFKLQLQAFGMEKRMEQSIEIVIYRMVQELLNNVIKHADAKTVLIQIVRKGGRFTLTVEDDGKGFDAGKIKGKSGAGLANVQARAEYLNGSVDVHSVPNEGTSITVEGSCI